jgi:hypothetical protein
MAPINTVPQYNDPGVVDYLAERWDHRLKIPSIVPPEYRLKIELARHVKTCSALKSSKGNGSARYSSLER